MTRTRATLLGVLVGAGVASGAAGRGSIPYSEVEPILTSLRQELLPDEIRVWSPAQREQRWPGWAARRDAEVRSRLARGDEDSIVNVFWFGTSFTKQPRLTQDRLKVLDRAAADAVFAARLSDLVNGILAPGANERLQFARSVLERSGVAVSGSAAGAEIRTHLEKLIARGLEELAAYQAASADRQSTLFRDRGLASDSSTFSHFAIEAALDATLAEKVLAPGSVRRVAIVGPGLDFTDKDSGYDFYPPQTIQPFAVIDSLLRLGLSLETPRVTTFDVSPRIHQHVMGARARASAGDGYVLQMPRAGNLPWNPRLVAYWKRFGERIGREVPSVTPPPEAGAVETQAVEVRPAVVSAVTPEDLNIVFERLELPARERFDLIVATNVLVYYGVFEQSLALANIAKMLRPGGILLSSDFVFPLPSIPMTIVGDTKVSYLGDSTGDIILRYQRQ
ncbi:MAG: hypothetical protein FJW23_00060 [Acidimicrobiia bacterium]|nr:hypothetical protein [Acidimicrobiia bacterium]